MKPDGYLKHFQQLWKYQHHSQKKLLYAEIFMENLMIYPLFSIRCIPITSIRNNAILIVIIALVTVPKKVMKN